MGWSRWGLLAAELLAEGISESISCDGHETHIHVATLVSELSTSLPAFMASAMWNLGQVTLLDDGRGAGWPPSKKLPIYRKYLNNLPNAWNCDLVLLIDAFDALILSSEQRLVEIVEVMERRTGSYSFFGTETSCHTNCTQQDKVAVAANATTPYRYLNSGLHIGRAWAMRRFFDEPIDMEKVSKVQDWCINVTLNIPGIAVLDYKQELFMNAFGVEGIWDGEEARNLRQPAGSIAYVKDDLGNQWVENRITRTRPPILHFPGPGKFPKFFACYDRPGLTCQQSLPFELVRRFYPEAYKGWRLDRMQAALDEYSVPWFLRTPSSPYNFQYQRLPELIEKFKTRDHTIAGLIVMDLLVLLLLAAWRCPCRLPPSSRCAKKSDVYAV